MTLEEALYSCLSSHAGVMTLTAGRIYPNERPQGASLPALTYRRITGARAWSMSGYSRLQNPRMQIDCIAPTYAAVRALADQAALAVITPGAGFRVGELTDYDLPVVDAATETFHQIALDLSLWYPEEEI